MCSFVSLTVKRQKEAMEKIKTKRIESWVELQPFLQVSSVPMVIWCYWAGTHMNENRQRGFEMMQKYMGVPICLITELNINEFIVNGHPFHPAFQYLSPVHQSDYLRIYLLHHYGGGWHDIKPTMVSINPAWDSFKDPDVYLVGKPEIKGGPAKVFNNNGLWMPEYWRELVATNRWVGRAKTPFTYELYNAVNHFLDENMEDLRKNPARNAYDKKKSGFFSGIYSGKNQYPLPYTVFGNLFHPLNYEYRNHFKRTLPFDEIENLGYPYR
jgi:hypothetical protein